MPEYDYFFLSYASANHLNARWEKQGNSGNYLDEFFDALCREVSDQTARPKERVAYRDRTRLKIADFWNRDLVSGLQRSRVLVSLISPHYLQSADCGRELAFFDKRLKEHIQHGGDHPHRILPIFWQNSEICLKKASEGISRYLKQFNFSQEGMPANYPAVGLSQICQLRTGNDYERFCHTLARRIVELADELPPLPQLTGSEDFSGLESIFVKLEREAGDKLVFNGPVGANVVFVVGTRDEMQEVGVSEFERYAQQRESWCPFPEAPGATVKILTEEGVRLAGLEELRSFEFPDDLLGLIEAAQRKKSPVLIVFDRSSLGIPHLRSQLSKYDRGQNFEHCGLVTVGGLEVNEIQVREVFKFKGVPNFSDHIWDVPRDRATYVSSVSSVLSAIKRQLMRHSLPTAIFRPRTMPGLTSPSGS